MYHSLGCKSFGSEGTGDGALSLGNLGVSILNTGGGGGGGDGGLLMTPTCVEIVLYSFYSGSRYLYTGSGV
jgi:hypothetical protein